MIKYIGSRWRKIKMKTKGIEVGKIFTIDNSLLQPKLKLPNGFIDMATQYIYVGKEEVEASVCTESELNRIQQNWRMTSEKFEDYEKSLIKKFIGEDK